jgi:hypothetical protein
MEAYLNTRANEQSIHFSGAEDGKQKMVLNESDWVTFLEIFQVSAIIG